jgi:hypothetical protein
MVDGLLPSDRSDSFGRRPHTSRWRRLAKLAKDVGREKDVVWETGPEVLALREGLVAMEHRRGALGATRWLDQLPIAGGHEPVVLPTEPGVAAILAAYGSHRLAALGAGQQRLPGSVLGEAGAFARTAFFGVRGASIADENEILHAVRIDGA